MRLRLLALAGCLLGLTSVALAQDLFVYPKNNQTAEQQQKDQGECYTWARNQTGFDPMAPPTASRPAPQVDDGSPDGSVLRGAARGALLGEIVSDDAGKGAAAGAAIGAMRRRDRQRNQQAERDRWEQEEAARYNQMRNSYNRAFKGCMEARDYSVS